MNMITSYVTSTPAMSLKFTDPIVAMLYRVSTNEIMPSFMYNVFLNGVSLWCKETAGF